MTTTIPDTLVPPNHSIHFSTLKTQVTHPHVPDSLAPAKIMMMRVKQTYPLKRDTKASALPHPSLGNPHNPIARANCLLPCFRSMPLTCNMSSSSSIALSQSSIIASSSPCSSTSTPSASKDKESLCSGHFMQSTRQLHPMLPITYNKTALMRLQGRLQTQMLSNIFLPFSSDDSDWERSPGAPDSNNKEEESPSALKTDCKMVKSPTAEVTSAVPEEESPMS